MLVDIEASLESRYLIKKESWKRIGQRFLFKNLRSFIPFG